MCGIVAYLGKNQALPILIESIKRLEYRGYDSAGVAVYNTDKLVNIKAVGKIKELEKKIAKLKIRGNKGIAHTRWATHGEATEENAHPHHDCQAKIFLAHNGIIENYQKLKNQLINKGHKFYSDTDTEVIAHLLEEFYSGDITTALRNTLKVIIGTYGLVLFHADEPNKLLAARKGSPLVVGLGQKETIVASDVAAIVQHTRQVIYLDDGEIAEISYNNFRIFNAESKIIDKPKTNVEWDIAKAEKQGYDSFILKEISEQPNTIIDSIRGRTIARTGKVKLGGLEQVSQELKKIKKIIITACGTAWHSGLVGEYMMEEYAQIPVETELASEFRYRKPVIDEDTAVLALSQSGETADTLAAIKEAKEKGTLTLGIVNVVGSSIARATDAGVYNHIGPEISVASTKAFTSQLSILALLTIMLGRQRQMSFTMGQRIIKEMNLLSKKIKICLKEKNKIKHIAKSFHKFENMAFLGRKYNFPLALESALKVKELSYIHAEGLASGEIKHGPLALIDKDFPSIFISPLDSVYEKNVSNMVEIKSRGGKIIAITSAGNKDLNKIADEVIFIPKTLEMLTPILAAIPIQLFAYYLAVYRSCDVDQPRNLAKSVTVE